MTTLPDFFTSFFAQFPKKDGLPRLDLNKLPQPPDWLIGEVHNRIVLLLNHVLQQDPEAMQRLSRQSGRVVKFALQPASILLTASPVGLLVVHSPLVETLPKVDLLLEITDTDMLELGQKLLQGAKPNVRIEGDIQLAAEVQWLTQNVAWDLEDDLAKLMGDVPAHHAMNTLKLVKSKLATWLSTKTPGAS
jgi:ubiquinone biosynthesis protein UbiJ